MTVISEEIKQNINEEISEEVKVVENTLMDGTKQKLVVVIRNANDDHEEKMTFGDKLADTVARGGGSWKFIIAASIFLAIWTTYNIMTRGEAQFDPYPFVFLNLLLSMTAALQAPIIMMSQNRQSLKDRLSAQLDYEINCKAEAGILELHGKIDKEIVILHDKIEGELLSLHSKLDILTNKMLEKVEKAEKISASPKTKAKTILKS